MFKIHGGQFNIHTSDVREWLNGLHGIDELPINFHSHEIHSLNELYVNVLPCDVHSLNEMSAIGMNDPPIFFPLVKYMV